METTTQELIYQFMMILVSGLLTILGAYLKKLISTKIDIEKYGFENERVERIIDNAINFAEQKAKIAAKHQAKSLSGSDKLDLAKKYINKVDRKIIEEKANELEDMIDRKLAQKFGA